MKFSNIKSVFSTIGLAVILTAVCGSVLLLTAAAAQAAPPVTGGGAVAIPHKAGALLKGNDHFTYYVTETGARRPLYNQETLAAFGFEPENVVKVDNNALSAMPMAEVLTRLVLDDQDNLFWVVNGQRWQINAWKDVVNDPAYNGVPLSRLNRSLQESLPVRVGLKPHTYLRQNEEVYYFADYSIFPLAQNSYDEADVIEVPSGVLAVYPQADTLDTLWTRLNAKEIIVANVRRGPGPAYETIGIVNIAQDILVTGRAKDTYWLKIIYQGQTGWLAGDLIKDQALLKFLPG